MLRNSNVTSNHWKKKLRYHGEQIADLWKHLKANIMRQSIDALCSLVIWYDVRHGAASPSSPRRDTLQ